MHRFSLIAVVLVGACSNADALDARFKPMVGSSEGQLLAAMGREPDASIEATGARVLQWRWQRDYAIPDRMLAYSYAGGSTKPIPHTRTGLVSDECLTEWIVENGIATRYRWEGAACAAAVKAAGGR